MVFGKLIQKYIHPIFRKFGADKDFSELLKGSLTTLIVKILGNILGFSFMLIVTNAYGDEGAAVWGKYLLALLVLRIFVIVGRFGADTALLKFIAGFNAHGLGENIRLIYKKALTFVLPVSMVLSVIMYFGAGLIGKTMKIPSIYIEYLAFFLLPFAWMFINTQSFRGLKDMLSFSFFFNSAVTTFAFLFIGFGLLFFKEQLLTDHQAPLYAFSMGIAIAFILSLFLWLKKSNKITGYDANKRITNKNFLNMSVPLMLAQSITFIMGWTDQFMLGILATPEEVGIYGVAFKHSTLAVIVLLAINSIATPKFAEFHSKNDIKGLKKIVKQSTKMIFWTTIPIVLFLSLFAEWVMGFSGQSFKVGAVTLLILLSGRFYSSVCGSVGSVLQMTGNQHLFQNILLVAAILNVLLNYILIPISGIQGAAIASFFSVVFWNTIMVIIVKRKFGFITIYIPFIKL